MSEVNLDNPIYWRPDGTRTTAHERQLIRRKQAQQDHVVADKLESRKPKEANPWRRMIDQAGNHSPSSHKGKQIARWEAEAEKWDRQREKQRVEQAEQERLANDPDVQAAVSVATEWLMGAEDDDSREAAAYRLGLAKAGALNEFWELQAEVAEAHAQKHRQAAQQAGAEHSKAAEKHYTTEAIAANEHAKALEARHNAEQFNTSCSVLPRSNPVP